MPSASAGCWNPPGTRCKAATMGSRPSPRRRHSFRSDPLGSRAARDGRLRGRSANARGGRAAERFLTTENTEQHGKEIRMCFYFCVLPFYPWLLPVLTIGAPRKEVER